MILKMRNALRASASFFFWGPVLLLGAGCSWLNPPVSSEEVIQQDPAFADTLKERQAISAEVDRLQKTLTVERHALLREIQRRREELREKEKSARTQIDLLEQRLDPARQMLEAKLAGADDLLRRTEATLKGLYRTRTEMSKLLQQAGDESSMPQTENWRQQLASINEQVPALEQQKADLERHRKLYRAELRLLKR